MAGTVHVNSAPNSHGPFGVAVGDGYGWWTLTSSGGDSSSGSIVENPPTINGANLCAIAFNEGPGGNTFNVAFVGNVGVNQFSTVAFTDQNSVSRLYNSKDAAFTYNGTISRWAWTTSGFVYPGGANSPVVFGDPVVDFNCPCETISTYATLLEKRTDMLIRLGYPNQAANPPPGTALLIDTFLRDAQKQVYKQLQRAALRTERFFKWTMEPGSRYYTLDTEEESCTTLDPYKVTWVGFEDLNQAWYRLTEGIRPEWYTRANITTGWPTHFEIRSCIEIFPAPQAAYTLWIKGDFGLGDLTDDTDRFTIDDEACYLLALGNAKAHYGQADAQLVLTQAANYAKALVAGTHGTKQYIPRAETQNPLTPPRFLPLGNAPP